MSFHDMVELELVKVANEWAPLALDSIGLDYHATRCKAQEVITDFTSDFVEFLDEAIVASEYACDASYYHADDPETEYAVAVELARHANQSYWTWKGLKSLHHAYNLTKIDGEMVTAAAAGLESVDHFQKALVSQL